MPGVVSWTVPIAEDKVAAFEPLLEELFSKHREGFEERAAKVGYYRESMTLERTPHGAHVIICIEYDAPEMKEMLEAVRADRSAFSAWWGPRFLGLVGEFPAVPSSKTLFSWHAAGREGVISGAAAKR